MNNERRIIIEEVARIALEDMDYRNYLAHELDLSDAEMETTYQELCSHLNKE
jgi:hypothetical protein